MNVQRVEPAPRHASGVWLKQGRDSTKLVDSEGRTVHVLNSTALALWELCDGETTAGEMSAAVCQLFDADPGVVEHDVRDTLAHLTEAGLLEWSPPLTSAPEGPRVTSLQGARNVVEHERLRGEA